MRHTPERCHLWSTLRCLTILVGSLGATSVAGAQPLPIQAQALDVRQPADVGYLPGGTFSTCQNLCHDGSVLVGSGNAGGGSSAHAWRWTPGGGLVDLGAGLLSSNGYAISGDGQVIVGSAATTIDTYAFRWTAASGMQFLTMAAGYQGRPILAFGASHDGSVVTGFGYFHGNAQRVFRWSAATGGVVPLDQLLPGTTTASGGMVSADGSTVIGFCWANSPTLVRPVATVWDAAGTPTSLGVLAGSAQSIPQAVNASGSVVVGYCADTASQNHRAFRWSTSGGMIELAPPPGATWAESWAVTADGSKITGEYNDGAGVHAFIWTAARGMQDLSRYLLSHNVDTAYWEFTTAFISGDGSTLAGWGKHHGVATSWRAPAH